jgi:hypothetical protein
MISLLELQTRTITKARRQNNKTKRSEGGFLIGIIKQESSKT